MLADSAAVFASDLTVLEASRLLIRAEALCQITTEQAQERRALLERASALWTLSSINEPILDRVRRPFPVEPVRTLDAIHLSSALLIRNAVTDLALLSLDDRVRANGQALGFPLLPQL